MFENTDNNHSTWTYNGVRMAHRQSSGDIFGVDVGTASTPYKKFSQEVEIALDKILTKNPNSKICVAFSGGKDSEYVVRKLHKMKVDFQPVFWRLENGYNDHDYYYARLCCDELKINLKVVETDTYDLFFKRNPTLLDYAIENTAYGMSLAWYMWNFEHTDYDVLILGDGILTLTKGISFKDEIPSITASWNDDKWFYRQKERLWCLRMFAKKINRNVIADFYLYTPELILSQIKSPEFKKGFTNNSNIKDKFYNLLYNEFPTMKRRTKYHGMENKELQTSMSYHRRIIYNQLPRETYLWIPLDDFRNRLLHGTDMEIIYKQEELENFFSSINYFNVDPKYK